MRTTLASTLALAWLVALLANPSMKFIHLLLIAALGFFVWSLAVRNPKTPDY